MTRHRILTLVLALALWGCSDDDSGALPDLAPADGTVASDGGGPDGGDLSAGPDQAQPDRGVHPDLYVQPAPALGNVTLVVNLGDSIAAAYGVPSGSGYIDLLMKNDDAAHPTYKGKDLGDKFPGAKLSDRSYGGATSPNLPGQVASAPANKTGDTLVVISIGGNDMMLNYMALLDPNEAKKVAATVQANVKKVLAHFADKSRYPNKTTVLMFNVYEFTDGSGTMPSNAPVDKYCGMIKLLGPIAGKKAIGNMAVYNQEMLKFARDKGLVLGDMAAAFLGHGFNHADKSSVHHDASDPTLWFQTDCIHPNKAGHAGIRAEAWRALFGGK